MSNREAEQTISGGYFISRLVPRPAGADAELLPAALLSASDCLCPHIPDYSLLAWATSGEEGRMVRLLNAFQLPIPAAEMLVDWVTHEYEREVGHPNIFYNLSTACEVARNFFPNRPDVIVCGLGLPRALGPAFLRTTRPPGFGTGLAPEGPLGTYKAIASGRAIAEGGEALGYELLVYDLHANELGCSWLCGGLERTLHALHGVTPNECGLIGTLAEASRATSLLQLGAIAAEPGLWLPWLLTRYPVESIS